MRRVTLKQGAIASLLLLLFCLILFPDSNRTLFLFLHHQLHRFPDVFWRSVSVLGNWQTVLALLLALSWYRPQRLPALLLGSGLATGLTMLLKAGLAVPRPSLVLPAGAVQLLDIVPASGAFPSGHAVAAATLATALATIIQLGAWQKAMPLLVVAVMLSRLAIGVHWPSDVLAGALLGWLVMRFSCRYLWPQGWPKTVTTCVQGGLLLLLWWLYGRQAVRHDADWLLRGIEGSVAVWGVVRLLWQQNRKQGSRF